MNYREYEYFENDRLWIGLLSELGKVNIEENENGLNNFLDTCERTLDIHVPHMQKYARANHIPFLNNALS